MVHRFDNVLELIEHTFSAYKNKPAYTCLGKTITFAELDALSQRFASYLQNELGLSQGERVAIQMPNILQYPVALYGCIRAGMVVVNTNPLYTPRELKHQLKDSGAKALVVLSNVAQSAAEIIQDTDVEKVIVTDIADLHDIPKRWLMNFAVKHIKKMVPDFSFRNMVNFRDALAKGRPPVKAPSYTSESLLMLQYTGGTTGVSKGAMLSHGNMSSNVWQMIAHMPKAFNEKEEVYLTCLPLYHIYAANLHGLAAFSRGGHNVLVPNPRDLQALVDIARPYKITVFIGINTLFNALCRFEPFKQLDFSKLKITASGGMALTEDAARLWKETTGCQVCEGYGLTETSPVVCGNISDNIQQGTIGLPLPETEVKIIDSENTEVDVDEVGELCVRGPQVMRGYWQRSEETAKVLSDDGWLKTGDMAIRQTDGFLRIVDRKKDMIIVSGFNVYPNEVEDVVCQHEQVVEAAAIGVADEKSGEIVKLFVVPTDDSLTKDTIHGFCRKNLTAYKVPKIIEFRESLPKSNVGKILRRELRDA